MLEILYTCSLNHKQIWVWLNSIQGAVILVQTWNSLSQDEPYFSPQGCSLSTTWRDRLLLSTLIGSTPPKSSASAEHKSSSQNSALYWIHWVTEFTESLTVLTSTKCVSTPGPDWEFSFLRWTLSFVADSALSNVSVFAPS